MTSITAPYTLLLVVSAVAYFIIWPLVVYFRDAKGTRAARASVSYSYYGLVLIISRSSQIPQLCNFFGCIEYPLHDSCPLV